MNIPIAGNVALYRYGLWFFDEPIEAYLKEGIGRKKAIRMFLQKYKHEQEDQHELEDCQQRMIQSLKIIPL